jgi:hypothetical protein
MHEYKVEVVRDGRWWMIHVPEIDGLTQARRVDEVEDMARSLIAISTDTPLSDVSIHVVSVTVAGIGDIAETAHRVEHLRRQAEELETKAADAAKQYARDLTREGVPVRDAASLLGVSPQRISQLAKTG